MSLIDDEEGEVFEFEFRELRLKPDAAICLALRLRQV